MSAYYNEIDPFAAAWLRELISAGHIASGDVDERSIEDVKPGDLRGYRQCHFFAGIGGWSYALRLAGWPDDKPVWTGSCPCQPFSAAGKGAGFEDERHLWPAWFHLIQQCSPATVFGEQVASKAADIWVDLVHADLEAMGYAFGCVPFPAAGVRAPHIRDRAYFFATDANSQRLPGPYRNGQPAPADGSFAWSELARVHAERGWRSWLSESGTGPLINGVSARVVRVRGYGNAIVPQAAAEFILACEESRLGVAA